MNRSVVAGVLGLALAGCAQSRSALPKAGPNAPPVGLAPVPPIHQIINRSKLPADPRADGPVGLAEGPAPSETAPPSEDPSPGRPSPFVAQAPRAPRPRLRSPEQSQPPADQAVPDAEPVVAESTDASPAGELPPPVESVSPAPSMTPAPALAPEGPTPVESAPPVTTPDASPSPAPPDPLLGASPDATPPVELPPPPAVEPIDGAAPAPAAETPVELPPLAQPDPKAASADPPPPRAEATPPSSPRDPETRIVNAISNSSVATVRSEGPSLTLKKAGRSAASVGDDFITLHELDLGVQEFLRKKDVPAGQSISREELNMIARMVLDQLIERSMIVQEARRKFKNPKQIDMFMEMADKAWREEELPPLLRRTSSADELDLKRKLADRGQSLDEIRESYRLDCLAREFLQQELRTRMSVELPEMRNYYNEHLKDFDRPAQVTWREVVVEVAKHPSRAEARRKADGVLARLRVGEDFAQVAQRESDGPNKAKGGLWETTPGSYAILAVNDALDKLPPKQVSPILETPDSFHIIRVESRRPAGPATFAEVQDVVRRKLREQTHNREATAYLNKLRKKTLITSEMFENTESAPTLARPVADSR